MPAFIFAFSKTIFDHFYGDWSGNDPLNNLYMLFLIFVFLFSIFFTHKIFLFHFWKKTLNGWTSGFLGVTGSLVALLLVRPFSNLLSGYELHFLSVLFAIYLVVSFFCLIQKIENS